MTFVVPFEGSELARTALARGRVRRALRHVRPPSDGDPERNADYAVGRGWLDPGEEYDVVIVRHAGPSKVETLLEASWVDQGEREG